MAPVHSSRRWKRLQAVTLCVVALCVCANVLTVNVFDDVIDTVDQMPKEVYGNSTHNSVARNEPLRLDGVRVTFLVVNTKMNGGWCRMMASSIFCNVTVVSIGAGRKYKHTYRPMWVLEYMEAENLRDEDVIVIVDGGDNVFTSERTVQKALRKFIAATAPTADAFDGAAVRRGEALAPVIFGGDFVCFPPQIHDLLGKTESSHVVQCTNEMRVARAQAGMDNTSSTNPMEPGSSDGRYLNAGGVIARVWAMKRATVAFRALFESKKGLWCDQSLWLALYLWSLINKSGVSPELVLPLGLLSIDFRFDFFLDMFPEHLGKLFWPWNESVVSQVVAKGDVPLPLLFDVAGYPNATPMVLHILKHFQKSKENMRRSISYLPWFREVHRNAHTLQMAKRRLAETIVEVRASSERPRFYRFADLCPVEDVLSMEYLSSFFRNDRMQGGVK